MGFYIQGQYYKYRYNSFDDVTNDKNLLNEFEKYIQVKENILLPGQKELNTVNEKISQLDSMNTEANNALKILNNFYINQKSKQMVFENRELEKILLLEFAGFW